MRVRSSACFIGISVFSMLMYGCTTMGGGKVVKLDRPVMLGGIQRIGGAPRPDSLKMIREFKVRNYAGKETMQTHNEVRVSYYEYVPEHFGENLMKLVPGDQAHIFIDRLRITASYECFYVLWCDDEWTKFIGYGSFLSDR